MADQLGVTAQTSYNWRSQAQIGRGERPGLTTAESVELVERLIRLGEDRDLALSCRMRFARSRQHAY